MPQETPEKSSNLIADNAGMVQFLLIAGVTYFALYQGYIHFIADSALLDNYLTFSAKFASGLLALFNVEQTIETNGENLRLVTNIGAYIDITRGSDGFAFYATLIACIAGWPGNWAKKIIFLLASVATLFLLNAARLAAMLLVDIHTPLNFDLFNKWILPGLLILVVFTFFLFWTRYSGAHPADHGQSN